MCSKLLDQTELLQRVTALRAGNPGVRIVFTNGCFDLLHVGHVRTLWNARKLGDILIVAVNDDDSVRRIQGPNRPILACRERMKLLAGLASVDWLTSFGEDTPLALIQSLRPDILVKGGNYEQPEEVVGHSAVAEWGGETRILELTEGCSSSDLIQRVLETRATR